MNITLFVNCFHCLHEKFDNLQFVLKLRHSCLLLADTVFATLYFYREPLPIAILAPSSTGLWLWNNPTLGNGLHVDDHHRPIASLRAPKDLVKLWLCHSFKLAEKVEP